MQILRWFGNINMRGDTIAMSDENVDFMPSKQ